MISSHIGHASGTSLIDIDSSQIFLDGSAVLPSENNTTNIKTMLPSSITLTPRRSVKGKRSLAWRYFKVLDDFLNKNS
jgi:hypothetical protein